MPRITPLPPKEWPPEMRDAFAALRPAKPRHPFPEQKDRPKGLNALGTLAHHPALTQAFNTFNGYILFASTLMPRQRELLVLRLATVRSSAYEWAQHAVLASDVGISPDEIARITEGPDAAGWTAHESAMLRAVDELVRDTKITDATWKALAEDFDTQQIMDLIFTVGAYETLAMAFASAEIELDDDLKRK
jgi:alkylhydroperoxidase family enzyme